MRDAHRLAFGAKVEEASVERARNLADQCAPFRPALVALEVEAVLDRGRAAVIGLGVRAVGPRRIALVADALGTVGEDLIVVVGGQGGAPVTVGGADRHLRPVVVGR